MQPLAISRQYLRIQIIAALLAIYLFWGASYLPMKTACDTIPPFIMNALRFFTVSLVIGLWEWRQGMTMPAKAEWQGTAKVGGLLLVCATGGLVWAGQFIPSGIAAIIFATVPLWMAFLSWLTASGNRPNSTMLTGLVLGFCGVAFLIGTSLSQDISSPLASLGYIIAFLAAAAWAWGSLYSRTAPLPKSPFLSIAMQNVFGGIGCLAISLLAGEWTAFNFYNISFSSMLSLAYLILFGSIIGLSAYLWLLKVTDPMLVATYAYVNPIVALFIGWAFADETLTLSVAVSVAIILTAVYLITKAQKA